MTSAMQAHDLPFDFDPTHATAEEVRDVHARVHVIASQNDIAANGLLGYWHHKGIGVEQSISEAIKYYRRATDLGGASAALSLGVIFRKAQRLDEAFEFLGRSGEKTGPDVSKSGARCSNKGFLPMLTAEYLQLLDWTAGRKVDGKSGATPQHVPRLLERLGLNADQWSRLVQDFGRLFSVVAGQPHSVDGHRSKVSEDQPVRRRYHARREAREVFAKA